MSGVFCVISIFVLYWGWNDWKKNALRSYRDRLFDIRDHLRRQFVEMNVPLDHPAYKKIRAALNQQIRYAEDIDFATFLVVTRNVEELEVKKDHFEKYQDETFYSAIKESEDKAVSSLFIFFIESNAIVLLTSLFIMATSLLTSIMVRKVKSINKDTASRIVMRRFFQGTAPESIALANLNLGFVK